ARLAERAHHPRVRLPVLQDVPEERPVARVAGAAEEVPAGVVARSVPVRPHRVRHVLEPDDDEERLAGGEGRGRGVERELPETAVLRERAGGAYEKLIAAGRVVRPARVVIDRDDEVARAELGPVGDARAGEGEGRRGGKTRSRVERRLRPEAEEVVGHGIAV